MQYFSNVALNEKKNRETAAMVSQDILYCVRFKQDVRGPGLVMLSYLLYKAARFSSACSYQDIIENKLDLHEDTLLAIKDYLNEDNWNRLQELLKKYTAEEFALVAVLADFSNLGMRFSEMTTPDSIVKLAKKILDIQPNDRVGDLCCGVGTFLLSAAEDVPQALYFGCEMNYQCKIVADIRAELLGYPMDIQLGDVFGILDESDPPLFDKTFSNYPFGLKLRSLDGGTHFLEQMTKAQPQLSKATSSDWVFNALTCSLLAPTGKAVAIMTNGSSWNSIDMPMRQHFVNNGLVEAVIALPPRMFSCTMIPTTMIVFSHKNKAVRMVDASKLCQEGRRQNEFTDENIDQITKALHNDCEYSKQISMDELRENEYTLNPARYLQEKIAIPHAAPFSSVIKNITRGAQCKAKELDEMVSDTPTDMQYLMLANIQDGIIDNKLPYLSYLDPKHEKYCLKNNSLILSKNGYPYKVAVASVKEGQKVLANGNLYIIELDEEKINPYYLKAFFESEAGIASLKSITVGATIPNIGVDKLKKLPVPVPPMEEQNRIVARYQATLDEIAILKMKMEKATNRLHHIFDEESED